MELDAGGCRLAFHQAYGPDGPTTGPTGSPRNPHKIVFHAENVEAMRDHLLSRGVQMDEIETFGDLSQCDGIPKDTGSRFPIAEVRRCFAAVISPPYLGPNETPRHISRPIRSIAVPQE